MFNLDLQRTATAIVGALLLSTVCVGAAVAPAQAVPSAPAHQISATLGA